MKQIDDQKTGDLLEGFKRPVGRPSSGMAKSAAQRQKERRERLKATGVGVLTVELPQDILDALAKFLQFKDETQGEAVARILRDRLLRKR